MRSSDIYQITLISLGVIATALFGVFVYRELFPEYKIYQNDYIALEKFRSSYTGEPPPAFQEGVKQIVLLRKDLGPPTIDRCTSCHVALEFPHFSPTKIAYDINGEILLNADGIPEKIPNEDYIWAKVDQKIADLRDTKVIEQLTSQGETGKITQRLKQASDLEALKTAHVGDHTYDVTKVLRMHPLIGKETRPFEFHPINDYGCVSCHSGNGRGLTTEKAHGPIFDGEYEAQFQGPKREFLELDPKNDPLFARAYNDMPGHDLIFQTTPLLIGSLIESKCVQCHLPSSKAIQQSINAASDVLKQHQKKADAIKDALNNEEQEIISILLLKKDISSNGLENTIKKLTELSSTFSLPPSEMKQAAAQLNYMQQFKKKNQPTDQIQNHLDQLLIEKIGSKQSLDDLLKKTENSDNRESLNRVLDKYIEERHQDMPLTGTLFKKVAAWDLVQETIQHVKDTETSWSASVSDQQFLNAATSDIDVLTHGFHNGQQLFISQACYACHKIAGFSRGGVGPELTNAGESYIWFIKEKISWPQGSLPTSTMPNQKLDHEEIEGLMTFILAQHGESNALSGKNYKVAIQEWNLGSKLPWEKPISPAQMHDLRYAMTVFATEGCAACHRLKGFESNVGYSIEKQGTKPEFEALYSESQWFSQLFPEDTEGSRIVSAIESHAQEIDNRIVNNVRSGSLLEEIEKNHPGQIEAFYANFKYANRAKNDYYDQLAKAEKDPAKKAEILSEKAKWHARIERILMMYVQEYGLGRLIGPRPNWSGIFRTDQWLMEHFHNPSGHTPQSIMPVFPFDDSKFYALTYMLNTLSVSNRNAIREIWEHRGFNPELAAKIYCAQCHGEFMEGNGPVAEWIYPIPKNLRNADFLRHFTKERAIQAISHGVRGTPMPPWGEVASDKPNDGIPVLSEREIQGIVNWMFSTLPGGTVIRGSEDVPKWQYSPEDALKELEQEGGDLKANPNPNAAPASSHEQAAATIPELQFKERYYASLEIVPDFAQKPQNEKLTVSDVFNVTDSPLPGPDKYGYYIKDKFYTEENIQQGKEYFELNCAVCHGSEADGTGPRSQFMQEAKPRMLTNLDWIDSRDDLNLLRAIKFGKPGTSMTPWGDLTTSKQRLQLVMFIRSLSREQDRRNKLLSAVYQTYDTAQQIIDNARVKEYAHMQKTKNMFEQIHKQRQQLLVKVEEGTIAPEEAAKLYQLELEWKKRIQQHEKIDDLYIQLKSEIQQESNTLKDLGSIILSKEPQKNAFEEYLNLIALTSNRFQIKDGSLQMFPSNENEIAAIGKNLISATEDKIRELQLQKNIEAGKMPSTSRMQDLAHLDAQISAYTNLKNMLIANLDASVRSRNKQTQIYEEIKNKTAQDSGNVT
jgi:mono/diheme cytochrome c family protein